MLDRLASALRHSGLEGLLISSGRSEGNFRIYDNAAVEQLIFIKRCRSLDLSLSEIRQHVELNRSPDKECDDVYQMIDGHIQQVEQRTRELEKLQRQLKLLRYSCTSDSTVGQCGILRNLFVIPSEIPPSPAIKQSR